MRLPRAELAVDGAGSVAEHLRALAGVGRGRLPAAREARRQQLVGSWAPVPDGDRHQRAQSRGVEDQEEAIPIRDDHIVGELVLDHDVVDDEGRLVPQSPAEERVQATEPPEIGRERLCLDGVQPDPIIELHPRSLAHRRAPASRGRLAAARSLSGPFPAGSSGCHPLRLTTRWCGFAP